MKKLAPRCRRANGWYGRFPYLVLWEYFVHFLPSHVSNAPQPSQISIAAFILTIISGRDRCSHFISCSPRSASLSLFLPPSFPLSHCIDTAVLARCHSQKITLTHRNTFQSTPRPRVAAVMNAWLIRQYFTVIHQVSEGHFGLSALPNPSLSLLPSLSSSVCHSRTHSHRQTKSVTHSSKMTAQSGRKRRCVRPAPCIPIKMSELWVILSCTRKGTSLERQTGSHISIIFIV